MLSTLSASDVISAISLVVAVLALWVSCHAIYRSNKTSSAAIYLTLNGGFHEGWRRYLREADPEKRAYEFAELMNVVEIACAIHISRSLTGVTRELLEEYLGDTLSLIEGNEEATSRLRALIHSETTFKYVTAYLRQNRRRSMRYGLGVAGDL